MESEYPKLVRDKIPEITALRGKLIEDIEAIQIIKREKRGGFEKRILMNEPPKPQS